jgi:hypothetical protein
LATAIEIETSASQALIITLASYQINSELVWDFCHSPRKLAKHNKVQVLYVLGHKSI